MISPGLLAQANQGKGLLPDEDLVENPLLANQMAQQNQVTGAGLPALQAANLQAETQSRNLENEKSQAFLPVYQAALARYQNPSQGSPQPPANQNGPPSSSYQTFQSLIKPAADEANQNEFAKSQGLPLTIQNTTAMTQAKNDALAQASQEMATAIQGIKPTDKNGKANAIAGVIAKYPLLAKDLTEEAGVLKETSPQINMAGLLDQPIPQSIVDNASKRILNGQSTIAEETTRGRLVGPKALEFHDALVNAVSAQQPDFSEAENEGQRAFANSAQTKKAISQLDNAYSTVKHLRDVYSNLNNSQFPTVNAAINGGKVQSGDVDAARAAIGQALGNDELTQAFARGGQPTDKLRDLSGVLADKNMSPQQQGAQFDEILQGLQRSRAAYSGQGGKFIKPLDVGGQNITTKSGKTYQVQVQ